MAIVPHTRVATARTVLVRVVVVDAVLVAHRRSSSKGFRSQWLPPPARGAC
jgi:hypothetical protein